tara:strand:+ start:16454 stop:16810 length:357 start_codon:yes stop_codon:yes gene_type:complete
MNFEEKLREAEEQYDERVSAIAEEVRRTLLIPVCDKYNMLFMAGNGTWFLELTDEEGEKFSVESLEAQDSEFCFYEDKAELIKRLREDRNVRKLIEALSLSVGDFDLGSVTNDYDGRQ